MRPHKLTLLCCGAIVFHAALSQPPPVAPASPDPSPVFVSEAHRAFLSRLARRTIRDTIETGQVYEPKYIPTALNALKAEVIVRVRRRGYLLTHAGGGPGPIAVATRDAALATAKVLAREDEADVDLVNRLLIEIEVIGPGSPFRVGVDWTRSRALDPFVEPGVHGLSLTGPGFRHRFCPTELFTTDSVLADALQRLAKAAHASRTDIANVELSRFRTVHWYQRSAGARPVSLQRGLVLVPPFDGSPAPLDNAIERLVEYMVYRQLKSGLFAYQFEPGRDLYTDENNIVRQVGAVAAMAIHARWSGRASSRAAADLGLRYHLQGLTALPDVENAAYIATADKRNKLGVTALLCLAMTEYPDPKRYALDRDKLVRAMLWLQRPSGMFLTAFPPALEIRAQDYFPGEALLALAEQYTHEPSTEILDAFDRAVTFYQPYFRGAPSPAFVPWQVQAFALMARHSKRKDYQDYVFELTDWLARKQLTPQNCRWPELWGGIAAYSNGRAGVATAAYLEGFADALSLARQVGDTRRAERYERLVKEAARFVMQLQVRPEESYFMRSPQDAVGGIRTSPSLNLLRIDHCQHALVGLIKARDALFPDVD